MNNVKPIESLKEGDRVLRRDLYCGPCFVTVTKVSKESVPVVYEHGGRGRGVAFFVSTAIGGTYKVEPGFPVTVES